MDARDLECPEGASADHGDVPDAGRRRFAGLVAGAVSAFAGLALLPRFLRAQSEGTKAHEAGPAGVSKHPKGPLRRWGMSIDLDTCTACGACVVACRTENNVPCSGSEPERQGTGAFWMNILPSDDAAEMGERAAETLPVPCMHCEDPPCVKVCPVGATYVTDEGITAQIYERCIGCRYCEVACPYGVRQFNWGEPNWPESYKSYINPDVSTRPQGVVEKCTFCHHRIQRRQEEARLAGEPLADVSLQRLTACAEACPAHAITFGDLNDEASEVSRLHRSPRAFKLLENLGTKPKVVYLARDRREGVE
jgi:molybdopterin-containing oxidoreductase family iron-sulfur binding subunit